MIDTAKLDGRIGACGMKMNYVASALGLTPESLRMKRQNKTEFSITEITKLSRLLGTTTSELIEDIFLPEKFNENE